MRSKAALHAYANTLRVEMAPLGGQGCGCCDGGCEDEVDDEGGEGAEEGELV